jgi:hypothetical protein
MRLALIGVYVLFISATGLTAHSTIPDNILNDDMSMRYGGDHSDLFNNNCPNKHQTTIDRQIFIANDYLFDNHLSNARQTSILFTNDEGETKRINNYNDKMTKAAGSDYLAMYTGNELTNIDRNGDHELADTPAPSNKNDNKLISWLKNTYQLWAAKDHYGSTRLLLLSFGLVGIIGIRRKFTKH